MYLISKSSWERFPKKGVVFFTVIYMVTLEEKTFSCTVTILKKLHMRPECFLIFYLNYAIIFHLTKVDSQWVSKRNQLPEFQCITRYKSQIYLLWKHLSVEPTEVQRKINISPQNIWCWQDKNCSKLFLFIAKLMLPSMLRTRKLIVLMNIHCWILKKLKMSCHQTKN